MKHWKYCILKLLHQNSRPMTVNEISNILQTDYHVVCAIIFRLYKQRLVTRDRPQRYYRYRITDNGIKELAKYYLKHLIEYDLNIGVEHE